MKTHRIYLGIDVSKRNLHIANEQKFLKEVDNNNAGFKRIIKLASKEASTLVIVEASGGYERSLCDALHDAGIEVHVAQPNCVRYFAKSVKVLAKTDAIDAQVIARFGAATQPLPTPKTRKNVRDLRSLSDRRDQIIDDRIRETNRLEKATCNFVIEQLKASIERLRELEKEMDAKIKQVIKTDDELKQKSAILRNQTGVGPVTATILLAQLPELGHCDRQSIAALVGLAPHANESGKWSGKRKITGGRSAVRKALYLAARTAAVRCPVISQVFKRLKEQGKPYKVAIIACARKMLIYMNTQLKKQKSLAQIA